MTVFNESQCNPPLPDSEVATIARSVCRYDPEVGEKPAVKHHDIVTVRMSEVQKKEVSWLWHKRIPIGRITLIEGDGGVCKSWLTMAIASHVTTGGFFPGSSYRVTPGNVLVMSAEDSIEETIVARLMSQGADLNRVAAVECLRDKDGERQLTLNEVDRIDLLVKEMDAKLVVIDPVIAYLGGADMNHASSIRSLLAPLHALAERRGCAVILVRHLNKSSEQSARYRGQGSQDFYSAARSVFQIIPDSVDRDKRHMVHTKSNGGPIMPTLELLIEDDKLVFGKENWESAESLYRKLANKKDEEPTTVESKVLDIFPGSKVVE